MDEITFDKLARAIGAGNGGRASRRGVVALLAALGAGSLAAPDRTAAHLGRCNPLCGECELCKRGKCRRKHGRRHCRKGTCLPAPGQPCPGGICLDDGSCGTP